MSESRPPVLSDDLLRRFHERAPAYDRENRFFAEDFEDLRKSGYLKMAVPREFGGLGLSFSDCMRETRRLAYWAPATALGTNMHTYWCRRREHAARRRATSPATGCSRPPARARSSPPATPSPATTSRVLLSNTKAERVDGGYRFTGRKAFGSLSPVWTLLGLHGIDTSDPKAPEDRPRVSLARDAKGYRIEPTWDVLGMRATKSDDTILEGAFVPDAQIARIVPPGAAGLDLFVLSIFAWALVGFANVYYGLGRRVFDLSVESLGKRSALGVPGGMAHHPETCSTAWRRWRWSSRPSSRSSSKTAADWIDRRRPRRAVAERRS